MNNTWYMTKKNWNAKIVGALHSSWVSTKQQTDIIILDMELLEKEASWDLFLNCYFRISCTREDSDLKLENFDSTFRWSK